MTLRAKLLPSVFLVLLATAVVAAGPPKKKVAVKKPHNGASAEVEKAAKQEKVGTREPVSGKENPNTVGQDRGLASADCQTLEREGREIEAQSKEVESQTKEKK